MKKNRLAILLVACFAVACGRDVEPVCTELRITARPESAATRTVLRQDNSVAFVSTDTLAVFDGSGRAQKFTTSAVYDDGSADFAGTVTTPAESYIAVYPYSGNCGLYGDDVIINIPAEQTAVAGSFDPAANVSVGLTESLAFDTHSLALKNVCALIKFSVPEGQSYSTAILFTFDAIAGKMLCSVSDTPTLTPQIDEYYSTVTMQGRIEGGKWYYMAVNPTVLQDGFALYLFDSTATEDQLENYAMVKSTSQDVTLSRSRILNLGIIGAEPGAAFEPLAGETVLDW